MTKRTKRNPRVGKHPDLFETHDTDVYKSLSDMSEQELKRLRRADFTDEEWDELPDEIAEAIYKQDEDSQKRVKRLVDEIVERFNMAIDPGADYAIDDVRDYFSSWLREEDENLVHRGGESAQELINEFVDNGWARQDVEGVLTQVMLDASNYNYDYEYDEPRDAFFHMQATSSFYITRRELDDLLEGMYEDEIEIALDEIDSKTYRGFIRRADLDSRYGFDESVECDAWVVIEPDWSAIYDAVAFALEDIKKRADDEGDKPIKDRIVYTFSDGAYVVDLLPSELADEGNKQGICVGKPQYGYAIAVRQGKTKILSLRTQAGRPKFTIEVATDPRTGRLCQIKQIKGKANRLPSKPDEVNKLVEFVRNLGMDPNQIADLQPGLRALTTGKPTQNPPEHQRCHCGFCRVPIA